MVTLGQRKFCLFLGGKKGITNALELRGFFGGISECNSMHEDDDVISSSGALLQGV